MISAGSLLAIGAGAATGGVGGAALAGGSLLVNSGNATDQARATREDWTVQEAKSGSTLAAAIALAAPDNVSNNEAARWRQVVQQIPANILQQAISQYGSRGWWPEGLPDFYTDVQGTTHQQILAEVAAAQKSNGAGTTVPVATQTAGTSTGGFVTGTGTGSQTTQLPAMQTTAKAPSMWLVVGGIVLLVVLVVVIGRRR